MMLTSEPVARSGDRPQLVGGMMRVLDLFCKAGGAGEGYRRAGFEVVGVDNAFQTRYKPGQFVQADALKYLIAHGHEFDLIHTSPPCQKYSRLNRYHKRDDYPDLIEKVRELLQANGKPYVIENVPEAPLQSAIFLCGTMFGLRVLRHRSFETSPVVWVMPGHCNHWGKSTKKGKYSTFANGDFITVTGNNFLAAEGRLAMGIDWMTKNELREAIPPAYTEWLGRQMLKVLQV